MVGAGIRKAVELQRWIPILTEVGNVRAERSQGIDQNADGPLAHARGASHDLGLPRHGKIRRQEAHRRARIQHVGSLWFGVPVIRFQQADHGLRVTGSRQVLQIAGETRQGVDDEGAVAFALGRG